MCNNVKEPLTFSVPTRRNIEERSCKTPGVIIREQKAVSAGKYTECNIRLTLACDCSDVQKYSKLKNWGQIWFYMMVAYIYSTHVLVGITDKMSLLAYLLPSDRFE
jgi:hypothetical protein